jgi:hypothetical protein
MLLAQEALADADEVDVSGPVGLDESVLAVAHNSKLVIELYSPDTRSCAFFRLVDVPEADPVNPGSAWFAVPTNHLGYDVIIDNLRAAIVHDKRVTVNTTGTLECGHAAVARVRLFR